MSENAAIKDPNIKELKRRSFFMLHAMVHDQVVTITNLFALTKVPLTFM